MKQIVTLVVGSLLALNALFGQTTTSQVSGVVQDSTGLAVP